MIYKLSPHPYNSDLSSKSAPIRVTFTLPGGLYADSVHLVGDFNNWNRRSHPLRCDRRGQWSVTLELEAGRNYHFRYLVNGQDWMNDNAADGYIGETPDKVWSVVSTYH